MNAASILNIVGVISLSGATLYSGLAKGTIRLQKDEIEALRGSQQRLSSDNKNLTTSLARADERATVFQEAANGVPDFAKLSMQLTKQHKEVVTVLGKVAEQLGKVAISINKEGRR